VTLDGQGALLFPQVDSYIVALEQALAACRGRLEILREQEARRAPQ